jgi:hypothetical protein
MFANVRGDVLLLPGPESARVHFLRHRFIAESMAWKQRVGQQNRETFECSLSTHCGHCSVCKGTGTSSGAARLCGASPVFALRCRKSLERKEGGLTRVGSPFSVAPVSEGLFQSPGTAPHLGAYHGEFRVLRSSAAATRKGRPLEREPPLRCSAKGEDACPL